MFYNSVSSFFISFIRLLTGTTRLVSQVDTADDPSTEPQFIHGLLWGFVLLNQTQQTTLPQNLSSSMAYCEGLCCSIISFLCVTSRQSRLPFHRTSVHPWLIVRVCVAQSDTADYPSTEPQFIHGLLWRFVLLNHSFSVCHK